MTFFDNIYDYIEEKGTNPVTKDKVCIEVAPRSITDYNLFTYEYDIDGEPFVFSYNMVGKVTYKEMLDLTNTFIKQQKYLHDLGKNKRVIFTPLTICKKVFLDYIAIFIANLKLKELPVLFPLELDEEKFIGYAKYNHFFEKDPADFYIFSSGSTGVLNKPKPAYEKDIIKSVVNEFVIKNHIHNEKFYSTMSMNGIAGVMFNAFFPFVTDNQIYINDNTNFFENISYTKSTMFILPLNYMDFLPITEDNLDFSHVKYILISGGYFNMNDIENLLTNLPGLKKESLFYLYSSTELGGKSVSCAYKDFNPINLSMPELLKGNVAFSNEYDSIQYLSSGEIDKDICQILDNDGNILPEDKLGTIRLNNVLTEDLGIIHNKRLYVIGRRSKKDEIYNLSILNNYFRYHLNDDVACGIYRGELIVYVDLLYNYYGSYTKNPNTRLEVYDCYKANFMLRDKANELITKLENDYDIEFYGDAVMHKFYRNERLEKIRFNYEEYNPFDYDFNNTNGANLFDTYYFFTAHFEEYFMVELFNILFNNFKSSSTTDYGQNNEMLNKVFSLDPINRILNVLRTIDDNPDLIVILNIDDDLHEMMREILFIPSYLSLDFIDMHHFDINHSDMTAENIRESFAIRPIISEHDKPLVREIIYLVRDLQDRLNIDIYSKEYYSEEMYDKRMARAFSNADGPYIDVLEDIIYNIKNTKSSVKKIKPYHWFWRS